MSIDLPRNTPRRVIVALDATSTSPPLEAIVRLAAELRAELFGLFVEEAELLEIAALPATRAIPASGVGEAFLDEAVMRRALRAHSGALRRTLEELTARWQVTATYEVVSGNVAEHLSTRTTNDDLLTLGAGSERQTQAVTDFIRQAPCAVLRMRRGSAPASYATVVIDNGEDRLLTAGLLSARAFKSPLKVLVPPRERATTRQKKIADWLERHHAHADIIQLDNAAADNPTATFAALHAGMAVYDRMSEFGKKVDPNHGPTCSFLVF